jgi:hypothetical protein
MNVIRAGSLRYEKSAEVVDIEDSVALRVLPGEVFDMNEDQ